MCPASLLIGHAGAGAALLSGLCLSAARSLQAEASLLGVCSAVCPRLGHVSSCQQREGPCCRWQLLPWLLLSLRALLGSLSLSRAAGSAALDSSITGSSVFQE